MSAISIREVTKVYPGGVEALRGVSLECAAGQVTALLRTQRLRQQATLPQPLRRHGFPPPQGEVHVASQVTSKLDDAEVSTQLRRNKIGFVFQFFQLLPSLTALENVELPLLLSGAKNTEAAALERLRWVGLDDKARSLPYQLSGGQMQRTLPSSPAPSSTIPPVLIADEPTGNLDNASGDIILKLIRRAADELGAAVLIATHSSEAAAIADVRVRMGDGRIEGN